MEKLLIIIDGNSLMNRAYYALPELMNKKGQHTSAVYGFANILFRLLDTYRPTHISVAFDLKAPTFRHLQYKDYKGTRKGMPEELREQVEPLKKLIDAFGINRLEIEGYEADDIIGTVSTFCADKGYKVMIITGDKDALQLASSNIRILFTKKGISELEEYGYDEMIDRYGITPSQFIDLKGLMGDKSDNIPGVAGIGEKTGIKLIQEYDSIENIYQNLDSISPNVKKKLEESYEIALLSKSLATIMTDIPIELSEEELRLKEMDNDKLLEIFNEFEFNTLITRLGITTPKDYSKDVSAVIAVDETNLNDSLYKIKNSSRIFIKTVCKTGYVNEKRISNIVLKSDTDLYFFSEDHISFLKDILENKEIKICGYKLKDDYINLLSYGIELQNMHYDLAIAEYLIDSSSSNYEIKDIATKYGFGNIKSYDEFIGKGKNKKEIESIDFQDLLEYYASIVDISETSYDTLIDILKNTEMDRLFFEVEMPLVKVLGNMEYTGICVDENVLNELKIRFDKEISLLETEIYELSGDKFNINSPKQLGVVLFEKLGLPAIKKTKTGFSTNAEVLDALLDKHPIIAKISLYRQYTKLQSTYVDGLIKIINPITKRIHSSFNQTITTTGRISSTDPNLQNIPIRLELGRELRKVFVAKENCQLVDADYSQIELRILAHIADDKNLIEAFSKKTDIHTTTASEVFNVPIDEVTKELRSAAKAVNFGIVYGISDFGLSNNLRISKNTAKKYIETYLDRYPGVKRYMSDIVEKAERDGYVVTYAGRRRYIPEINSKNNIVKNLGKRLAMNAPIQGSAADIIKIAMVKVYDRLKDEKLSSKLILQVHDELIIEAEPDEIDKVKKVIKQEMENAVDLHVKLTVDVEAGSSWYDTK